MESRYAVIKTMGNDTKVLELCASKEGAFVAKQKYRETYKGQDVQIDAIHGEIDHDADGNLIGNKYTLLYQL